MKKFVVFLLVCVLIGVSSTPILAEEKHLDAALLSCLSPGCGEWLILKGSFGSCVIEWLFGVIPILGWLGWIGSIIDAYKGVGGAGQERINILFTTFEL